MGLGFSVKGEAASGKAKRQDKTWSIREAIRMMMSLKIKFWDETMEVSCEWDLNAWIQWGAMKSLKCGMTRLDLTFHCVMRAKDHLEGGQDKCEVKIF